MVDFMAKSPREKLRALFFAFFAVSFCVPDSYGHGPFSKGEFSGRGKAPLYFFLFAVCKDYFGVYHLDDFAFFDFYNGDPAQHPYLRGGEPHPSDILKRFAHIVQQSRYPFVDFIDRFGFFPQI
jgi:hypothetical protein